MNRKTIVSSIIFILVVAYGGFYLYQNRNESAVVEKDPRLAQSTLPKTAEDLVKDSSKDIVDPAQQTTNPNPVVTGKSLPNSDCIDKQATTFDCYEQYYKTLVENKGVAAAFADLKQRYPQNGYIQSQCHPITHVIGNAAVNIYPDVGNAYAVGDSYCWSGYYHGVMEGIVARISVAALPSKLNSICDNVNGKASYSFDYYNCVHGLGHGVMAITQDELFDSLKLCDNLQGSWEAQSCYGGAFMENVIVDNKNHYTKYLKPEEPLYPCTAVEDKYKGTCYLMQTSYMLKVTNSDFSKVFQLCSTVGNYATTCYQSLGRDASGRSISNADATRNTCNLGKDYDQKSNCIVGAVKDFISYHHSDQQAKQLCALLEEDLQPVCFGTTESYYKSF